MLARPSWLTRPVLARALYDRRQPGAAIIGTLRVPPPAAYARAG
jgi:hypothetical protein